MAQTHDGGVKYAAQCAGVSYDEYIRKIDSGENWCNGCKRWHLREAFGSDRSRWTGVAACCLAYRRARARQLFVSRSRGLPPGPAPKPPRNGDKRQARKRVNQLVKSGKLARPNELPCWDCRHVWRAGERRHEYDHFRGYAAENHLDVQPVCTTCHYRREKKRCNALK